MQAAVANTTEGFLMGVSVMRTILDVLLALSQPQAIQVGCFVRSADVLSIRHLRVALLNGV